MSLLTFDIKYMFRAHMSHRFMLVVTYGVTNYLLSIPLYRGIIPEIGERRNMHNLCILQTWST